MPNLEDMSFVSHGIHIFVDPKSLVYLEGLEMDWVRNGLNEGFEFSNPNERDKCGCGESFRV
jgi:iron-sulfur cluster assembly protein